MITDITGFTTKRVVKITGVTADQLDNWKRFGVLLPSLPPASHLPGAPCLYTFRDLIAIRVLSELRRKGVSQASLRKVVTYLRDRKGLSANEVLVQTSLITDGTDVYEVQGPLTESVLNRPGQLSFTLVRLDQVVREVQKNAALAEKAA